MGGDENRAVRPSPEPSLSAVDAIQPMVQRETRMLSKDRGSLALLRLELGPGNDWLWSVPDGTDKLVIEDLIEDLEDLIVRVPTHR